MTARWSLRDNTRKKTILLYKPKHIKALHMSPNLFFQIHQLTLHGSSNKTPYQLAKNIPT